MINLNLWTRIYIHIPIRVHIAEMLGVAGGRTKVETGNQCILRISPQTYRIFKGLQRPPGPAFHQVRVEEWSSIV